MIIEKNVWIIRPMPHGENRIKQFLEDNFIAIGYPTGQSFKNLNKDELKIALNQHNMSEGIGNVNLFVNGMNVGDYVVVPDDNKRDVYFGVIDSEYKYDPDVDIPNDGYYPHQRVIKWYFNRKPFLRQDLPEEIRGSLRYPGTIANITKHRSSIERLIQNEEVEETSPSHGNEELIKETLNVLSDLLKDDNSEVRLRAAEAILNYNSTNK